MFILIPIVTSCVTVLLRVQLDGYFLLGKMLKGNIFLPNIMFNFPLSLVHTR
jgi:hypothetical protein